jgi:hypothetical protein
MKALTTAIAILVAAGTAAADDKDDLAAAAKKTAEARTYSFKGETNTELPAFGGGGGGPQGPQKFEGKHDAEAGTHILTDTQEIVKIGKKTATRPRAEWRVTEEGADPQGGRGGGFGRGMRGMFGGAAVRAPHEELADFGSKVSKVTKKGSKETLGETECDVFEAELTEEAAKAVVPGGGMLNRIPDATISGSAKVWVDGDGRIVKYVVKGTVTASFQGNDFEMSSTRTTTIYDVERTKVEIPADAKKAIEKKGSD